MAQRRLSITRRPPSAPRRSSIDLHLTTPIKRETAYSDFGDLDSPYVSQSELSTPSTPNGHPISNPFQNILKRRVQPTPLPILKILPLCIARVAEGLVFAVIFRACLSSANLTSSVH